MHPGSLLLDLTQTSKKYNVKFPLQYGLTNSGYSTTHSGLNEYGMSPNSAESHSMHELQLDHCHKYWHVYIWLKCTSSVARTHFG